MRISFIYTNVEITRFLDVSVTKRDVSQSLEGCH